MSEKTTLDRRFFMKGAGVTALFGSAMAGGLAIPATTNAKGMGQTSMSRRSPASVGCHEGGI